MSSDAAVREDVVHVTSKGQATIPAHLRAKYGIRAPGRVRFVDEGGRLVVRPVRTPQEMRGSVELPKGISLVEDLRREHRREMAEDEKRMRRA